MTAQPKKNKKINILKLGFLLLTSLIAAGIFSISLRIAISKILVPQPQAILILGGEPRRTQFATKIWYSHPKLDIWVSDFPKYRKFHKDILRRAAIPKNKIYYSNATDTVTNFTGMVNQLTNRHINHLYLITSDFHLPRARAIATIVFGSRGIIITPIAHPFPQHPPESRWRTVRDCFRSIIWLISGRTGATFNPSLDQQKISP